MDQSTNKKKVADVRVKLRGKNLDLIYNYSRKTQSTLARSLVENAVMQLESGDKSDPVDFNQFTRMVDRQSQHIAELSDKVDLLTAIVESFVDLYISITPTDSYKPENYKLVVKDRHNQILSLIKKRQSFELSTIKERLEGDDNYGEQ